MCPTGAEENRWIASRGRLAASAVRGRRRQHKARQREQHHRRHCSGVASSYAALTAILWVRDAISFGRGIVVPGVHFESISTTLEDCLAEISQANDYTEVLAGIGLSYAWGELAGVRLWNQKRPSTGKEACAGAANTDAATASCSAAITVFTVLDAAGHYDSSSRLRLTGPNRQRRGRRVRRGQASLRRQRRPRAVHWV